LLDTLATFSLETAAEVTGVSLEQIRLAAGLYATAGKAAIIFGTGIMQQLQGTENV